MTERRGAPRTARARRWDTKDLARRLCHALDTAEHVVERLAPRGYLDEVEPENNLRIDKIVAETALLAFVASTAAGHDDVRTRVARLAEVLIPFARSDRVLLGVCLQPSVAFDYASAHVFLTRLGYEDARFDALLRESASAQACGGKERPPHRQLEQHWLRETWRDSRVRSQRSITAMSSASVLNWPMDLLSASRDDVYAFTHGLMYIMDFNVLPAQLPRPRSVILAEAEAALARCLDEEDYDLAGEVLLAWPLTGKRWSAAAAFAFRVLARVEDAAGFLPAPSTRLQRLNRLEGDDRADYFLATAYHTIYVMGLLCAVSLQPDRAPPAKISTNAALRGSADRILEFLDVGSIRSHWRDELDRFSSRERDAVAGLLLNVGLHRMTKQRNFVAMRQLLATAYQLGLANTPASSQAAEVLSRLSTFEQTARVMRAGASAP